MLGGMDEAQRAAQTERETEAARSGGLSHREVEQGRLRGRLGAQLDRIRRASADLEPVRALPLPSVPSVRSGEAEAS